MKEVIALVIAEAAEVERNIHLNDLKEALTHAWKAIYLVSALEFHLFPELKQKILPLRLAVEKLTDAPEEGLASFIFHDWDLIYIMHNQAYSEVMRQIKLFLEASTQ